MDQVGINKKAIMDNIEAINFTIEKITLTELHQVDPRSLPRKLSRRAKVVINQILWSRRNLWEDKGNSDNSTESSEIPKDEAKSELQNNANKEDAEIDPDSVNQSSETTNSDQQDVKIEPMEDMMREPPFSESPQPARELRG